MCLLVQECHSCGRVTNQCLIGLSPGPQEEISCVVILVKANGCLGYFAIYSCCQFLFCIFILTNLGFSQPWKEKLLLQCAATNGEMHDKSLHEDQGLSTWPPPPQLRKHQRGEGRQNVRDREQGQCCESLSFGHDIVITYMNLQKPWLSPQDSHKSKPAKIRIQTKLDELQAPSLTKELLTINGQLGEDTMNFYLLRM